jgi:hypothetical protein
MALGDNAPQDDSEAKEILTLAYQELFGEELLPEDLFPLGIAQAIGLMEGGYGRNFHNNWGAITRAPNDDGSCPADSFVHGDSSFELGEYQTCFRAYPTSLAGAVDFLRTLYIRRPEVYEAALAGDIRGVAEEMYASNYYMGTAPHEQRDANGAYTNVNNYIDFIGRGVDQIAHLYPTGPEPSSDNTNVALVVGLVAAGGLAFAFSR